MRSVFLVLLAAGLVSANAGAAQPTAEKSTAKRISNHIQQSGQLKNYRIGVTYKDGLATLAGTVTSEQQRDAAIQLAKEVKGVKRVECKLTCTEQKSAATEQQSGLANEFANRQLNELGAGEPGRQAPTPPSAEATLAGFQGEQSGVMQAYGNGGQQMQAAPQQQQLQRPMMLARNNAPMNRQAFGRRGNMPLPAPRPGMDPRIQQASCQGPGCYQAGPYTEGYGGGGGGMGAPMPVAPGVVPAGFGGGHGQVYENPQMPGYAWPSYASYPNYAALSYPTQYSPTAWPYIGPFYPYPQVPLAWRKVSLEWDDGWWFLDFSAHNSSH
jgi:hypothetical protein